jgi:dihydropteroate synthase
MGVVNVTDDSFYEGSRYPDATAADARARDLVESGADILDIGGESTRPGAHRIDVDEEWRRIGPALESIRGWAEVLVSVDTRKPEVARRALDAGADIINDVTALESEEMASVVSAAGAGLVLMHMRGEPSTMQQRPVYDDVVGEVRTFLSDRTRRAVAAGIPRESIWIDPGIGFGKTLQHNLTLLRELSAFAEVGPPVLVGTSRKSFIGHLLDRAPEARLFGTAGSVAAAILHGADAIRVHDVREMRDVARVVDAIREPSMVAP